MTPRRRTRRRKGGKVGSTTATAGRNNSTISMERAERRAARKRERIKREEKFRAREREIKNWLAEQRVKRANQLSRARKNSGQKNLRNRHNNINNTKKSICNGKGGCTMMG